jgi:NTE family protein
MAAARSCTWCGCFTRSGIETRWKAGHDHARKVLAEKPWQGAIDTLAGAVIHEARE